MRNLLALGLCMSMSFAGGFALGEDDTPESTDPESDFRTCPNPYAICEIYHSGSKFTAGCEGPQCFKMNYGEEMRIIAAEHQGLFPTLWHVWTRDPIDTDWFLYKCDVERKNEKHVKVHVPEIRFCGFHIQSMSPTGQLRSHYQHIASNPESDRLCWAECTLEE